MLEKCRLVNPLADFFLPVNPPKQVLISAGSNSLELIPLPSMFGQAFVLFNDSESEGFAHNDFAVLPIPQNLLGEQVLSTAPINRQVLAENAF